MDKESMTERAKAAHLYIHIPFCAGRCPYCDFYAVEGRQELMPRYVDSLLKELDGSAALLGEVATVYFGGGTPTVMETGLLLSLLKTVAELVSGGGEITVEANPSSVTKEMAACLEGAGVNRVSLGAQSFNERLRTNLGRSGNAAHTHRAMAALRDAGFDNISVDMLFGIPGQEPGDLKYDIETVLDLGPEHISYYELSVKGNHPYRDRWEEGLVRARKLNARFFEMVADRLETAGYRWYETSNFARPGKECRHNIAYWNHKNYVGVGAGAWSTTGNRRWQNAEDMKAYIDACGKWRGIRRTENLTAAQVNEETLMLGLRLDTGVYRKLVAPSINLSQEELLARNGLLMNAGGKIFLTRAGRFVANDVCARLLQR